jgi:hypothetical protein
MKGLNISPYKPNTPKTRAVISNYIYIYITKTAMSFGIVKMATPPFMTSHPFYRIVSPRATCRSGP